MKDIYKTKNQLISELSTLRKSITKLNILNITRKQQSKLLNNIIESLTHPFYVINTDDYTITMANSAAGLKSLTKATTCYALSHHRDSPCNGKEHPCVIKKILKMRKPVTVEHIHYDKEENKRTVEIHGYPIIDNNGNMSQVIEYNLDITERKQMERKLKQLAEIDSLTGIYNRRIFFNFLKGELNRSLRYDRKLSLIMFDIDFFKEINDTYGHDIGDDVLRKIVKTVKKHIRKTDILARYGGEEFMIISPETNVRDAKLLAEKIRSAIEKIKFSNFKVTISLGASASKKKDNVSSFIKRADKALYRAKENGRNRTEISR
jgi:diguanylate cyclase (GGDEF)-like protein